MTRVPLKHRSYGFTLIELMVTVALVAILTALSTPAFLRLVTNATIDGANESFIASLAYARSEAMKRGAIVSVAPRAGGWSRGWNIFVDNAGAQPTGISPGTRLLREIQVNRGKTRVSFNLPNTVTGCGGGVAPAVIAFTSLGEVNSALNTGNTTMVCVVDTSLDDIQRVFSINPAGQFVLERRG